MMTPVEAFNILRRAEGWLRRDEPIPLHWAIEHGGAVPEAWAACGNPVLLMELASFLMDRTRLVQLAAAIVERVLPYSNTSTWLGREPMIREAVDVAKRFASGIPVTPATFNQLAGEMNQIADRMSDKDAGYLVPIAAYYLMRLPTIQAGRGFSWEAGRLVHNASHVQYAHGMPRQIANLIREHLPVVALDDLIQAGDR